MLTTPHTHLMPDDWRDWALCLGSDPELFWADEDKPMTLRRQRKIAAVFCDNCPVAEECRNYARDNKLTGLWGGVYFADRHRVR